MLREPATTRRNLPASSSVSRVARGANTAAADSRAQICPEANLVVLLMTPLAPARDAHGGLPQHRLLLSADAVLVLLLLSCGARPATVALGNAVASPKRLLLPATVFLLSRPYYPRGRLFPSIFVKVMTPAHQRGAAAPLKIGVR